MILRATINACLDSVFRFKGSKEDAFQNSAYYVFQIQDKKLVATRVQDWYKCTPHHRFNTLSYDEVEKKWDRFVSQSIVYLHMLAFIIYLF